MAHTLVGDAVLICHNRTDCLFFESSWKTRPSVTNLGQLSGNWFCRDFKVAASAAGMVLDNDCNHSCCTRSPNCFHRLDYQVGAMDHNW